MDSSAVPRSEYLQTRLREKKVTNTRVSRPAHEDDRLSRSTGSGRDDGIFDLDDSRSKRKAPPNPTTIGPSAWRFEDRESAQSRRASGMSVNTGGSAPRTMGVREMEDHVDKLSKQNFDLKLEVFHRREQIDELEKKLRDLPRLEEDHSELLQMNEEMVQELERRDNAVDEAVVIICNLEEKVRALEEELANARPSTGQQESSEQDASEAQFAHAEMIVPEDQETPHSMQPRDARISGVSPHVSARLAELATPTPDDAKLSRLPSFLNTDEPGSNNLRHLFVDGDTVIRPIPSYATLLTRNEGRDDDDYDLPNSPRLSTLSESDFKSIYGREEAARVADDIPPVPKLPTIVAPLLKSEGELARESREARTTQWVADAATLPVKVGTTQRPLSPDVGQFQSLGDILHRDRSGNAISTARIAKKPAILKESSRKEHTPPINDLPVFGQNMFPPTPDTMLTRPSNQSTTSIVQEKSFHDAAPMPPTRGYSSLIPVVQNTQLDNSRIYGAVASRANPFPRELSAAYKQPYYRAEPDHRYANNDFGASLFRRDEYEEAPDFLTPRYAGRQPITWRAALDEDSMFGSSPPRGSPSPPRYFGARRMSLEALSSQQGTRRRPSDQLLRLNADPKTARASFSSQDGPPFIHEQSSKPVSGNAPDNRAPKTPVKSEVAMVESPQEVVKSTNISPEPETSTVSPVARVAANSISTRAASLRRRVNKFTRRGNGAAPPSVNATEPSSAKSARSNSITKHFKGLRRGSSSQTDLDDAHRASVFVEAAQAAAPFLTSESKDLPALPPASPTLQPKTASSIGSRLDEQVSRSGVSNVSSDSVSLRNRSYPPNSSTGNASSQSTTAAPGSMVPLSGDAQRGSGGIQRLSKAYPVTSYTAMAGAAAAAVSSSQYNMRGRQNDIQNSIMPRASHSGNRNRPGF